MLDKGTHTISRANYVGAIDVLTAFEKSLDKPGNYVRVARQYLDFCLDQGYQIGQISHIEFTKVKPSLKYILSKFIKFCRANQITVFTGPTRLRFAKTHFESELIKRFVTSKQDLQGKSAETVINGLNQYFTFIKNSSSGFIGQKSLLAFKVNLRNRDLSSFTINSYLGAGKQLCKWLTTKPELLSKLAVELASLDPGDSKEIFDTLFADLVATEQVKLIRGLYSNESEQFKDTLSELERDKVYALINNATDKALYALMAWSGLRITEVSEQIESVDLSRNLITVKGKGAKKRTIHLLGEARKAIRLLDIDEGFFPGVTSQKTRKSINHWFRVAGVKTSKITAHSLRHTAATLMLSKGVSLEFIRQQLGHSSLEMTLRYVARLNQQQFLENVPRELE